MEFYNEKIQLDIDVIKDILENLKNNKKMLVFGLGYDSVMWYEANNKNTYFIEDKKEYIELNKNYIENNNIIEYTYDISCKNSFKLNDEEINNFKIPDKILKNAPFDIILIDGPEGYNNDKPGRLIPCFWASKLSKEGTIIYIDDYGRQLEDYCVKKFFDNKKKYIFEKREKCVKINF